MAEVTLVATQVAARPGMAAPSFAVCPKACAATFACRGDAYTKGC